MQVVSRYDRRAVYEKLGEEEERVSVGKVSSFLLSIMCSLIRQVNAYEGGKGGKEKGYLRAFRSYFHPQQIVPITQQNECWKTASFSFLLPDIKYRSADRMGATFPSSVFRI